MDRAMFSAHVDRVRADTEAALTHAAGAGEAFDGIVFHAGKDACYHADDQHIPFRSVFYFTRFAPQSGPHHLVIFRPGATPKLIRVVPKDFWYEPPVAPDHPFAEVLDVVDVDTPEAAAELAGDVSAFAYVGNDPATAERLGIPAAAVEPAALMGHLDWSRAYKTEYEVACIRQAGERVAKGFAAARLAFAASKSEREVFADFLAATGMLENDCPFGPIIGWDRHAAILHYQTKETTPPAPGRTLLVDAGSTIHGYASDVTRTYTSPDAHSIFRDMVASMDALELDLAERCRPGQSFVDLHRAAHRGVARILAESGVTKVDADETYDRGLTLAFFPHGLGHHLGLQVHDVGGRLAGPDGSLHEPPADYPSLRTTRPLDAEQVVTIEPGLYFIPLLLDPVREGEHAEAVDWDLVDLLLPHGGIRVEDDIYVGADATENLTRPHIPGDADPA